MCTRKLPGNFAGMSKHLPSRSCKARVLRSPPQDLPLTSMASTQLTQRSGQFKNQAGKCSSSRYSLVDRSISCMIILQGYKPGD